MYQHGTVTAAAASVHMSQPAASALLKDLEMRLGFALFRRDNRRLHLTHQGRLLMPDVLNALTGVEAVDRLAGEIKRGATDRLTIGAVSVAAAMLLPPALQEVRVAYPRITFAIRAGSAIDIVEMAVDHRIDLGVLIGPETAGDRVLQERLAPVSLFAVLHPAHALAKARTLAFSDVQGHGLIVLSTSLPAGAATRQAMEHLGLEYQPLMEVAQSFTACELAGQGLGIAIVESLGARYAQRQGLITRHLHTMHDASLSLVTPRDRPVDGAGRLLRDVLKRYVLGSEGLLSSPPRPA